MDWMREKLSTIHKIIWKLLLFLFLFVYSTVFFLSLYSVLFNIRSLLFSSIITHSHTQNKFWENWHDHKKQNKNKVRTRLKRENSKSRKNESNFVANNLSCSLYLTNTWNVLNQDIAQKILVRFFFSFTVSLLLYSSAFFPLSIPCCSTLCSCIFFFHMILISNGIKLRTRDFFHKKKNKKQKIHWKLLVF